MQVEFGGSRRRLLIDLHDDDWRESGSCVRFERLLRDVLSIGEGQACLVQYFDEDNDLMGASSSVPMFPATFYHSHAL